MKTNFIFLLLLFLVSCVGGNSTVQDNFDPGVTLPPLNLPSPEVTNVQLPNSGTYTVDDVLTFKVSWSIPVLVVGQPQLKFDVGGSVRGATYVSGSGSDELIFNYTVLATDNDLDGISLIPNLGLNGGSLTSDNGQDALLAVISSDASVVILDGGVPNISTLSLTHGNIYVTGNDFEIAVTFNRPVFVTSGTPRLTFDLGGSTKVAAYTSGSGSTVLKFKYVIQAADGDLDGVTINSPLLLNGGRIRSSGGANATLTFTPPDNSGVRVNATSPVISSVSVPAAATYRAGDVLGFSFVFDRNVYVTGSPTLALEIGGSTRIANLHSGSGTSTLVFRYTISSSDEDGNGISLASPLVLNGGSILSFYGAQADLSFTSPSTSGVLIDGISPEVTSISSPAPGTFRNGLVLGFDIKFNRTMQVSTSGGTPSVNIDIGGVTRKANYVSHVGDTLSFQYTVANTDYDIDGITFGSVISLNGGTILSSLGNTPSLSFTAPSMTNVLVDGISPTVTSVTTSSAKTYSAGETIAITLNFNRTMILDVTGGTPYLSLNVGGSTKQATYVTGTGTSSLTFNYTVQYGDSDSDGIVVSSPLVLNGSTLISQVGNSATLSFTPGDTSLLRVDGIKPKVTSVTAPSAATYKNGDSLSVTLNFDKTVLVTGNPRISIDVGGSAKLATFVSGSNSTGLVFSYTVTSSDQDTDGITIGSTIDLNSGSIKGENGNEALLTYTSPLTTTVLVDGISPHILNLTKPSGGFYQANDFISLSLNFNRSMTVDLTGGTPRVALVVGATTRYATYFAGTGSSNISFRYQVQAGDTDSDGVLFSNTIDLNGGTLKSTVGNIATLTFTSPTTTDVLVGVSIPTITSITPPNNGNYDRTSATTISFTLNFSETVVVTGSPRLALNVGGSTKYATYVSGSNSTSLVFTFTVTSTDLDMDGISLTSIDLNSGAIKSSAGANSNLTYTSPNLAKVNVIYPDLILWMDPQDSSTLFENNNCTSTPVTTNNQPVGCMKDKSGKNNHAMQSNAALKPIYKTSGIQGFPTVHYDGTNDILSTLTSTDYDGMTGLTLVVIFRPTIMDSNARALVSKRPSQSSISFSMFLFSSQYMYYDFSTSGNRQSNSTIFQASTNYLTTLHFDGSQSAANRTNFYIDGSHNASDSSNTGVINTTTGGLHIGSMNEAYGYSFNGNIAEILLFRRSLNSSANDELAKIHAYLQAKWNI